MIAAAPNTHAAAGRRPRGTQPEPGWSPSQALLELASTRQEREVERRLASLTGLIDPVMIVLLGGIVLILVLAVMLPIVSMHRLVR